MFIEVRSSCIKLSCLSTAFSQPACCMWTISDGNGRLLTIIAIRVLGSTGLASVRGIPLCSFHWDGHFNCKARDYLGFYFNLFPLHVATQMSISSIRMHF